MIVFGDPGQETGFIEHPDHPGEPGWTHSKAEARRSCPPGGRVVDADVFVSWYNEHKRLQAKEPSNV